MAGDSTHTAAGTIVAHLQSRRAEVEGALTERLEAFIAGTESTLDCAIYDLRHPRILAAIANVAAEGKRLRIVYDGARERTGGTRGDPRPSGTQQAIADAGLAADATPLHETGRHLMHDKFLIRDGRAVWTGSANFTVGGLEQQDNNCLEIASPELAAVYTAAFEDLLAKERRHEAQRAHLSAPIAVGGATITPAFAPKAGEGIEDAIVRALRGAKKVRVMAFLISDPGILVALAPFATDRAFDIRGVYDPHGMQDVLRYTRQGRERFWFLHDPRFVAAPSHPFHPSGEQDFMHNKTLIIDDRLVLTGSYNFSENAEANDENLLVIESPALAAQYTQYFDRLHAAYGGVEGQAAAMRAPAAIAEPHREAITVAEETLGPRAHVFILRREGRVRSPFRWAAVAQTFRGQTEVGRTPHVIVYTDGSAQGTAAAQAVLQSTEADYTAVQQWFGGIDLPAGHDGDDQTAPRTATPVQVLIDSQAGGAYHFGCDATDIYIEPAAQEASGLMVAELVEIFEAAINNGWQCGNTNGEALSRALAVERNSALAPLVAETAQAWWANGHADFINDNSADDTNQDSNGCGTLFLYYLHNQLGFSWEQIVAAGGATLGACYAKLTGKSAAEGTQDFLSRLATLAQGGQLALPANGNPFPIGGAAQPGPSAPPNTGGDQQPVPVPVSSSPDAPSETRGNATLMVAILVVLVLIAIVGALSAAGVIHF